MSAVVREDIAPRLEQRIIGARSVIDLTNAEFDELVTSRRVLSDALTFEQRFEVLLGSYIDFEAGAGRLSLETAAGLDYQNYVPAARALLDANRLLMNLMTASRAWIDQVQKDFATLAAPGGFGQRAKALLSAQYDEWFDYRLMEALRNHAQHRGMPAHGYTASDGLHDALTFRCLRRELVDAGEFKKSVLAEMPDEVDLRLSARRYIDCLSKVHVTLRRDITVVVNNARERIAAAIALFEKETNESSVGLHIHRRIHGEDTWVALMLEWDEVRQHLSRKNAAATTFSRHGRDVAPSRK